MLPVSGGQEPEQLLSVEETNLQLHLLPQCELDLPVVNRSGKPLEGDLTIQLADFAGNVFYSRAIQIEAEPGATVRKIALETQRVATTSPSALGWYLLSYSIRPRAGSAFATVHGTVQAGLVIKDSFELRLSAPNSVAYGGKYPVTAWLYDPGNGKPYAGARIKIEMWSRNGPGILHTERLARELITDDQGYVHTAYDMPANTTYTRGEVYAEATMGNFREFEQVGYVFESQPRLSLNTDKPIYQPEQKVHMRALVKSVDKHAGADAKVTFKITNSTGGEEFRRDVSTSKFGVADADWEIPQKATTGDYTIEALCTLSEQPETSQLRTNARIRVGKYELPDFVVEVAPDRSYYLPGQDATIEVRGRYLTGQPVQQANVDVPNAEMEHGKLDETGKFTAQVSLKKSFERFPKSPWVHFEDATYTAYVTDLSTGRSHSRRFTLRLSHEPVHLYLLTNRRAATNSYFMRRWGDYLQAVEPGPAEVFVMSSYADGTPASVSGTIEAVRPDMHTFADNPDAAHRTRLGYFHTNRYGVGRAELSPLSDDLTVVESEFDYDLPRSQLPECDWAYPLLKRKRIPPLHRAQLLLRASDKSGRSGTHQEQIFVLAPHDDIRVSTNHALYHPGDPIRVTVTSNTDVEDVVVNISAADGIVSSYQIHLSHGHGALTVPYDPRFRGDVEVHAFELSQRTEYNAAINGSAHVIYPARQELQVNVKLERTTFAPGEMVNADVKVRSPDGKPGADELGILVFDQAVAEHTRDEYMKTPGFSINDYSDPVYSTSLAGFSYRDLLNLEPGQPFPEGLDVIAGALLKSRFRDEFDWYGSRMQLSATAFNPQGMFANMRYPQGDQFSQALRESLEPVRNVLYSIHESTGNYPLNEVELRSELEEFGLSLDDVRDVWGVRYRPLFTSEGLLSVLRMVSDGPDKKADSGDEFVGLTMTWPYFERIGSTIDAVTAEFHKRSGGYVRDYETLKAALKTRNLDLDSLRDRWGNRYRFSFEIDGPFYVIQVDSPGPNGKFEDPHDPYRDDVHLWTSRINHFQELLDQLNQAVTAHFDRTGQFPQNEKEMQLIVDEAKISPDLLLDAWGHPYYFGFSRSTEYGDRTAPVPGPAGEMNQITPATQNVLYLHVNSHGPEPNRWFSMASFRKVLSEQTSKEEKPHPTPERPPSLVPPHWKENAKVERPKEDVATFEQSGGLQQNSPGATGIRGKVENALSSWSPQIMGAAISAISEATGKHYNTTADKTGLYRLVNLPPGNYRIEFVDAPFVRRVVTDVPVSVGKTAIVDVKLKPGQCNGGFEVTGMNAAVTTDRNVMTSPPANEISTHHQKVPLFTPRVRQYFPETLVWQPEVITDAEGSAHISFPMADSLTDWTMSIVASNEEGQVGVTRKDLRSFQPFFIENDPPKVLTQGDQIDLPVVFRNYSKGRLSLQAELEPQPWFTATSSPRQNVTVAPNQNIRAFFGLRADSTVRRGKAKVIARNQVTGDAVEREVRVHPDGQEIAFSTAKLLAGADDSFEIQLPPEMMQGSNDTELRIYPNLTAHILDAIDALGQPPLSCLEPRVSKGYLSLLTLEILRKAGQDNTNPGNPRAALAAQSRSWLQSEYQWLAESQHADGGYPSWWKDSSVSMTAYVLIFLRKAEDFIPVDQNVITRAGKFLVAQQTKSGAWLTEGSWLQPGTEDPNLTAYVARALAVATAYTQRMRRDDLDKALPLAMAYLEGRINSWSDAWLVGNYSIAAAISRRSEYTQRALDYLSRLAHTEGATTYWELEANASPFDTWGKPGRVETTSLAVQALSMLRAGSTDPAEANQIERGLQFLLSHKDANASWYSMHSTVNVVEAIIAAMPKMKTKTSEGSGGGQARVIVNGAPVTTVELPPANAVVGPVTIEMADRLVKGANKIQISRSVNAGEMNVTALTSYYSPWSAPGTGSDENFLPGESRALRLKVHYDNTGMETDQLVRCEVEVERIGFRGYGVMQAEIGLPPGAGVVLDSLKDDPAHEIQPDRIVFYVRPNAGGSKFDFQFRLRYPIEALSGASMLYDYYNPESHATVRPVKFRVSAVKGRGPSPVAGTD